MTKTVHKIFIHWSEIIFHSLLPIGQVSEEAKKACNTYFKRYWETFTWKNNREKMIEDIFRRFLIASVPFI